MTHGVECTSVWAQCSVC